MKSVPEAEAKLLTAIAALRHIARIAPTTQPGIVATEVLAQLENCRVDMSCAWYEGQVDEAVVRAVLRLKKEDKL